MSGCYRDIAGHVCDATHNLTVHAGTPEEHGSSSDSNVMQTLRIQVLQEPVCAVTLFLNKMG